ncbi:MAG: helix-turn-helix transcriptional regulator [Mycobacteriales bacterium]
MLQGTPVRARRSLRDAVGAMRNADLSDSMSWALASLSQAEALCGDATAARRALQESRRPRGVARCAADFALAEALTEMVGGNLTRAGQICLDAAAAYPHLRLQAATLLHYSVRLGAPPARVLPRLAAIADAVECSLPRLQLDHVRALAAHDGAALESVADRFDRLGLWLCAAEAAAQAALAERRAGRPAAARARMRSQSLAARCDGVRTPMLAVPEDLPALSRREREVAMLAGAGLSNAHIAQRLALSPRTVESHLYQAFAKLGVQHREELAPVFGILPSKDQ